MGGGSNLERLTGLENTAFGMIAGIMAKSMNYPLLVIKNNTQQGLPTSFVPSKLYRGLPMACMNLGGTTAVQFGATGAFQKLLRSTISSDDNVVRMGGAFLGGLASGIPCSVWELTMIQQQRFGGSMLGVPSAIFREFGLRGVFRGLPCTLGRESLFTLAMLGITPTIQRELTDPEGGFKPLTSAAGFTEGLDSNVALAVGALSGAIFSATLTHPLDTIKTCQQGDMAGATYRSAAQTYGVLLGESGSFRGLFKGLGWRISLISTTFFLVNALKERLAPILFPEEEGVLAGSELGDR